MKIITKMIIFFVIAQFLALFIGSTLINNASRIQGYQSLNIAVGGQGEVFNAFNIIGAILIVSIFLLIIFLLPIRDLMIRVLEVSATIAASTIVLFVVFSIFNVPLSDLVALVISVILVLSKFIMPKLRTPLALIASAGVAAVLGFSLDPFPMVVLVIGIAIYDIIAVWWTKHMVIFAKQFVKMQTTFTITASGERGDIFQWGEKSKRKPKFGSIELGTGDLSIPAALCVSAYKLGSFIFPLSAILGAIVGLYLVLEAVEKERKIMPAMPSIGMFSLLFLFAAIMFSYFFGF